MSFADSLLLHKHKTAGIGSFIKIHSLADIANGKQRRDGGVLFAVQRIDLR